MDNKLSLLYRKDGTQKFLSSLIAILLGMVFGSILIAIVGLNDSDIGGKGVFDGIKLVFLGLFSTGMKDGSLTFGFNPSLFGDMLFRATPLIMTGLSVAGVNLRIEDVLTAEELADRRGEATSETPALASGDAEAEE
jgi:simple sugar transport system permease protein